MSIKILITGGTVDKEYDESTGKLYFEKTHIPEMLKLGRSRLNIKITKIMMIDSLSLTDSDMKKILKNCKNSKEDKIIVTHGTDKITDTAKFLGKNIKDKTIILTGSIKPFIFRDSDSLFNLGSALAFVQTLPQGVYISMHGKYFNWNNTKKNKQKNEFEETN
ncbi:asparaginase domain-containing protein [[Eubacterium] cellulosolvens]